MGGWASRSPEDGSSHAAHPEDLDAPDATFDRPDLTTFTRLDEIGLQVVGQRLEPGLAVLACRVVDPMSGADAGKSPERSHDEFFAALAAHRATLSKWSASSSEGLPLLRGVSAAYRGVAGALGNRVKVGASAWLD